MNWGLRPCWVEGCIDEGVRFIKQFPNLEALTLLVEFNEYGWPEGATEEGIADSKQQEAGRISACIAAAFDQEFKQDLLWKAPQPRVLPL